MSLPSQKPTNKVVIIIVIEVTESKEFKNKLKSNIKWNRKKMELRS